MLLFSALCCLIMSMKISIKEYLKKKLRTTPVYAKVTYLSASEKLKGKRILVTGGTGGIGLALAKRFVAEGAKVLIAGRNEEKLNQVAAELKCEALALDVTRVESFDAFLADALEKMGQIDCLVNNAGVSYHESFLSVTPEGFDQQISTNLKGPFFLSQKVLSYMAKNNIKGQVLFISSETGETADIRPYGLSKAAINSLVQGLAYLYVKKGIRVNAVAPGVTASSMTGFQADGDLNCSYTASRRVYLPEEMAEVAAFLLSDASGCVSGQIITCNNGNTINARWK